MGDGVHGGGTAALVEPVPYREPLDEAHQPPGARAVPAVDRADGILVGQVRRGLRHPGRQQRRQEPLLVPRPGQRELFTTGQLQLIETEGQFQFPECLEVRRDHQHGVRGGQ
ncbi:hypothetical protein OHA05_30740 [Streptomyces sp. NBC_00306]|nr:hypothetical protein [Streptomyces sp. NBC_00306]